MSLVDRESIATFAIIDLETNDLPQYQFNQCSITELSIYAFGTDCIKESRTEYLLHANTHLNGIEKLVNINYKIPELPRVLHKLTLMINPRRRISDTAEKLTGLSNDMLCQQKDFDVHTGDLVLAFLNRLISPICLVAHNGWNFDFPILLYVFQKIKKSIPSSVLCVDSWRAFQAIDDDINRNLYMCNSDKTENNVEKIEDILAANIDVDWQKINETTPHRISKQYGKRLHIDNRLIESNATSKTRCLTLDGNKSSSHVRRSLFAPKRGFYKLGSIYERIFRQVPDDLHRAESDVIILTKLVLHYGRDFLNYAQREAKSFETVQRLGSIMY